MTLFLNNSFNLIVLFKMNKILLSGTLLENNPIILHIQVPYFLHGLMLRSRGIVIIVNTSFPIGS